LWRIAPPHFFAPVKTLRVFPYLAQKNVTYRRNVTGHKLWQTANGKIPTPLDAVNTSGIGNNNYKTVSRYEGRQNTHSAKDWFVSNALTPGLPNE